MDGLKKKVEQLNGDIGKERPLDEAKRLRSSSGNHR